MYVFSLVDDVRCFHFQYQAFLALHHWLNFKLLWQHGKSLTI